MLNGSGQMLLHPLGSRLMSLDDRFFSFFAFDKFFNLAGQLMRSARGGEILAFDHEEAKIGRPPNEHIDVSEIVKPKLSNFLDPPSNRQVCMVTKQFGDPIIESLSLLVSQGTDQLAHFETLRLQLAVET